MKLQLEAELDKTLQMKTNKYHDNTCKVMFSVIHKNHLIKSPTYNIIAVKNTIHWSVCFAKKTLLSLTRSQFKATFCFLVLDKCKM